MPHPDSVQLLPKAVQCFPHSRDRDLDGSGHPVTHLHNQEQRSCQHRSTQQHDGDGGGITRRQQPKAAVK